MITPYHSTEFSDFQHWWRQCAIAHIPPACAISFVSVSFDFHYTCHNSTLFTIDSHIRSRLPCMPIDFVIYSDIFLLHSIFDTLIIAVLWSNKKKLHMNVCVFHVTQSARRSGKCSPPMEEKTLFRTCESTKTGFLLGSCSKCVHVYSTCVLVCVCFVCLFV